VLELTFIEPSAQFCHYSTKYSSKNVAYRCVVPPFCLRYAYVNVGDSCVEPVRVWLIWCWHLYCQN